MQASYNTKKNDYIIAPIQEDILYKYTKHEKILQNNYNANKRVQDN